MGSTDFFHEKTTDEKPNRVNVRTAYDDAYDSARHEYGSDPYNGTISTTSGFHVVRDEPMELSAAYGFAETDCENAEKWGQARAVPFIEYAIVKSEARTRKVVLDSTNTSQEELDRIGRFPALTGNLTKYLSYPTKHFDHERDAEDITVNSVVGIKVSTRKRAATTPGDAVRRYYVWVDGTTRDRAHSTIAEARKEMDAIIETASANNRPCKVDIRGRIERPSMPELVSGGVEVTRVELTAEVRTLTKTEEVRRQGWLFYGRAAT